MAKRLMVSSGIQFDSIDKLKKEAQSILDSVSKQINLKITNVDFLNLDKNIDKINKKMNTLSKAKLDIDGVSSTKSLEELAKTLKEIQGMSKYKIELMSDGQLRVITDVNNKLKETIRTVQNLTTGSSSVSISGDVDKNKKAVYDEIVKLQKTEYDLKTKLLTADGEYAKVLQEQLNYTQQINRENINSVSKSKLADEAQYNNLLKERSILEDSYVRTKAKVQTNSENKFNQDLLKQNDYLDKVISKLKIYQQAVNNKGGGKPTEQAELNNEISRQISQMENLKKQNTLLGTAEKNRINSTINEMRVQTNELVKYESSFSNLFKRMGMYAFGGSIIYSGIAEVKKGINDIVSLDSAMRDLTRVAKATQTQLDGFTVVANNMAKSVGTSTENIIKATEYYSKLGYAIDDASERAKNSTIFKNVGEFDNIDDASKALITISKGFDLNSLEDMIHIMDVANNTGNKFSSSTKDVADGLQKMGNALYEAGNTYEQAVGIFVAGNASIQDADVTGTALKTIAMRLRGMETEIDETSIPVSKLRDEIKQLTESAGQMVDIMVDDNTFKSTYQQMTELAEVYPKLTDGQRAYLQYVIAGQRQGNIFSGTMKNMQEGIEAYNSALESSGSSYEEQNRFMDSIEGKMNQFSETLKSIWVDAINSDTIKTVVDLGTSSLEVFGKMSNTFGALPTTIGIATTALVLFNKEMYVGITKNMPIVGGLSLKIDNMAKSTQMSMGRVISGAFNKFAESMTSASAKASVLSAKNTVLAVSFKAVELASALATTTMTMGLSLAITGIITGITKLVDKIIVTKEEMREMNEESTRFITDSGKAITQAQNLLDEKTKLEQQINDTSDITQRKDLESQLVEIEKELASVLPQSATGFNMQGDAISQNNGLIEEQIRLKKEQMEIEALGFIETNRGLSSELSALGQKKKQYEEMKLAMIKGEEYTKQVSYTERGQTTTGTYSQNVTQADLDKLNQEIQDTTLKASQAQVHIKWLLDNGYKSSQLTQMGFDTSAVNNYINSVNKATDSLKENTSEKEKNANTEGAGGFAEVSVEQATQNYGKAVEEVEKLDTLLQKINKEQQLTPDIVAELAKNYSELGGNITDINAVQEFLNNKIQDQVAIQQEAYQIMRGNDESYYNDKIKNSAEAQDAFNKFASEFVDVNSDKYGFDLKNFRTLNEAKAGFINQLSKPLSEFLSNLLGGSADTYRKELENTRNYAETKAYILAKLDEQITKAENRLNNFAEKSVQSATSIDALNNEKFATRALQQIKTIQTERAKIETSFNQFYASFNTSVPTFGTGSSLIGKDMDKNKDKTEKLAENLKDLRDRYYEVNNALKQLDNELEKNKALMENSKEKEKINYLGQQLQIIQKQISAQKNLRKEQEKELSELRSSLTANGFGFAGDGTVTNYSNRLKALTDWANSIADNDTKENAKDNVEQIAKNLERYTSLLLDEIPDVNNELLELQNTASKVNDEIKAIYREKLETVADVESQISDLIKKNVEERIESEKKALEKSMENDRKRIESKKKALKDEQELYNKQYSEDNYEAELNEERNKLLQLQADIDKLQFANDRKSQVRLEELIKNYEAQQKLINDKIAEHQNQAINDRFEQEQELIDKELEDKENAYDDAIAELDKKLENFLSPQNLTNLVSSAMKSGFVDVLGQTVNLNDAMNEMFRDTEVGIANLNLQYNDWLTNLNSIKDTIFDINGYMNGAGLSSRIDLSAVRSLNPQPISIDMGGITVQGNVDKDVLPDLDRMFKKQQDDIINIINKRLSGTR